MAPIRLSAPGPNSSIALPPTTNKSSPSIHRSEASSFGRDSNVGASNTACARSNKGESMGSTEVPVARMTWSNALPFTSTFPFSRLTVLRSMCGSTCSSNEVVPAASVRSRSMYEIGTEPPPLESLSIRIRSHIVAFRKSKRLRLVCLRSSQSRARSYARVCKDRRESNTTRLPSSTAERATCTAVKPPPMTSTVGRLSLPRRCPATRIVPAANNSSACLTCGLLRREPNGFGTLHFPIGPVANMTAAATTVQKAVGRALGTYCTRYCPSPLLPMSMAVPDNQRCGNFEASDAQKSLKSDVEGRPCISGCWSSPELSRWVKAGTSISSASLPWSTAKSIKACGSKAAGCAKAGERRCSMPSSSKRLCHPSMKSAPGSMIHTEPTRFRLALPT
mmetsp:Transcript_39904/g.85157  ORF Transcript_39904/g.85157 Transcript_39904/m.85157 type:complete len:392 (+) Transcript_39904:378-1553(+)